MISGSIKLGGYSLGKGGYVLIDLIERTMLRKQLDRSFFTYSVDSGDIVRRIT